MTFAKLIGFGAYSPDNKVSNEDLTKYFETSDEWIYSRTGIKSRSIAAPDEESSDMGTIAVQRACQKAGISKDEIECLIVSTANPDLIYPSTSCIIQRKAGLKEAVCFDVLGACAGFIYALSVANAYIKSGKYKTIAVCGAEKMTKYIRWDNRNTDVLFGDGAGCFILQASDCAGIIDDYIKSDGTLGDLIYYDYSKPSSIHMEGQEVFRHAVSKMTSACLNILKKNNMTLDDVKYLIPHQANARIIEFIAKHAEFPMDKIIMKVDHFANTSSASIPLAFCEAYQEGKIQEGDTLLFTALGAGITWGSLLIKI